MTIMLFFHEYFDKAEIKGNFQFWCNIYWNLWTILFLEKSLNLVTNCKVINYKATGRSHLFVILHIFVPHPCINLNVLHNWLPSLTGKGHKSEIWHPSLPTNTLKKVKVDTNTTPTWHKVVCLFMWPCIHYS